MLNKIKIVNAMVTEKELLKAAVGYSILQKAWKGINEREDKLYKEEDRLEKILRRGLAGLVKKAKFPKSISIKIGDYRISQNIRLGYSVKVKKIK